MKYFIVKIAKNRGALAGIFKIKVFAVSQSLLPTLQKVKLRTEFFHFFQREIALILRMKIDILFNRETHFNSWKKESRRRFEFVLVTGEQVSLRTRELLLKGLVGKKIIS